MISIVIPTYSRGMLLYSAICEIVSFMDGIDVGYEVILVLDGGSLRTELNVRKLCRKYPQIRGLILASNVGQQNATLAGIRAARYEYIITMDDDLEHDCHGITKMIKMLDEGYDVVYGVSERKDRRLHRAIGTCFKEQVFRIVLKKPHKLQLTSYKAMTRDLALKIGQDRSRVVYLSAAILNENPKIGQVKVSARHSIDRRSGYKLKSLIRIIVHVIVSYSHWPLISLVKKEGSQYTIKERLG